MFTMSLQQQNNSNPTTSRKANRASKRKQWSDESMIGAMQAVADGLSITAAAREYGVPRTTLQDRVLGKVPHGKKPGPKRYLNELEEKKLSEFLVETAAVGYGKSRAEIMAIAEKTVKKKAEETPTTEDTTKKGLRKDKITHGWFDSFMKRHPYLSLRKGDATAIDRMNAVTPAAINHYFDLLKEVLDKYKLMQYPGQIYNVDETGLAYEHRPQKIVTLKGQQKVRCCTTSNKSQTTVVACVNAIGQAIPPYVIYDAKTLNPGWMQGGVPGTAYTRSPNGWIDTDLFHLWIKDHFLQYAVSRRPLLLILDGHSTHYQPATVQYAKDNEIIMLCLPPHSSHATQPLDTAVFNPLKRNWSEAVHKYLAENPGKVVTKYSFSPLLKETWEKTMIANNICAGFRNSGIYPFNRDKVQPTVLNTLQEDKTESTEGNKKGEDSKGGTTSDTYDDELYEKRWEEGYDLYDESYVRWLKLYHPDDIRSDWLLQLEGANTMDCDCVDGAHQMVEETPDVSCGDLDEVLFKRRLEEGYDLYDEHYTRWLLIHHPEAVKHDWLNRVSSSSKIFDSSGPKDVQKEPQTKEITLNYDSVYGAMNKKRKRPIAGTKFGPTGQREYISEYLHQAVPGCKETPKRIRLTGARVLTSDEAMQLVQQKEDEKKQKQLEIEKRKAEKKQKQLEKEKQKVERESKHKEKQSKGRGKTKSSNTKETNTEINGKDLAECPICEMKWEDDPDPNSEWVECECKQWLHEQCINYNILDPYLCLDCINNHL